MAETIGSGLLSLGQSIQAGYVRGKEKKRQEELQKFARQGQYFAQLFDQARQSGADSTPIWELYSRWSSDADKALGTGKGKTGKGERQAGGLDADKVMGMINTLVSSKRNVTVPGQPGYTGEGTKGLIGFMGQDQLGGVGREQHAQPHTEQRGFFPSIQEQQQTEDQRENARELFKHKLRVKEIETTAEGRMQLEQVKQQEAMARINLTYGLKGGLLDKASQLKLQAGVNKYLQAGYTPELAAEKFKEEVDADLARKEGQATLLKEKAEAFPKQIEAMEKRVALYEKSLGLRERTVATGERREAHAESMDVVNSSRARVLIDEIKKKQGSIEKIRDRYAKEELKYNEMGAINKFFAHKPSETDFKELVDQVDREIKSAEEELNKLKVPALSAEPPAGGGKSLPSKKPDSDPLGIFK